MHFVIRIYAIFVFLWFMTNIFLQDAWWPLVVLDKFAEYFLVAAVPLLVLSLVLNSRVLKKRSTILLALIPVVVAGYFYAPLLKPNFISGKPPSLPDFSIATYNIWNHNTNLPGAVKITNATNADVVAIQELTDVQQAEFIERMSVIYPHYYVSQPVYGGTTALFSKFELENIQELDFDIDRPAILADIRVGGSVLTVVSAHLNPSFWAYHDRPLLEIPKNYHQYIKDQNTQAQMIIDAVKLRKDSAAAFLACDCNSQETASTNKLLRTYFKDTLREIGFQLGRRPVNGRLKYELDLSHIDYIWFAGNVTPRAIYRARESAGSDHAPVMAEFAALE